MYLYRIKNWQDIYEVNRTRELKTVKWIPLPVKLSGDGYCMLMEDEKGNRRKDGPAMFGAFVSIIELAACCEPRGCLIRSTGEPHTFDSIGRICRISPPLIEQTILFCVQITKWIEIIELNTNCGDPASTCEIGADAPVVLCNTIPVLSKGGMGGEFENQKYGKRSKIKTDQPEWKSMCTTFEDYQKWEQEEYEKIIADSSWIQGRIEFHGKLNIVLSIKKAHTDYWSTKEGWKKIKSRKGESIDWRATWANALTMKSNQVWLKDGEMNSKPESKPSRPELSIIQSRLVKKLGDDYDFPENEDHDAWYLLYDIHFGDL